MISGTYSSAKVRFFTQMDMMMQDLDGIVTVSRRENDITVFCQEIDRSMKSIFVVSRKKSDPKILSCVDQEIICYNL